VAPVRADGDLAAAVGRLAAVPVEGEGALAAARHRVGLHGLRALALRQAWVNRGVAAWRGGEDEACRLARRCQRLWEDDPQALVVGLFADLGEVLGGDRRAAQALGLWGLTAAVVEAVGRPDAWEAAVAIARPGGEVLLYGGCAPGTTVTLPTFPLHYGELAIRGSYHHTPEAVREALAHLAAGDAPYDELLGDTITLDEVPGVLTAGSGLKRPVVTRP
jgi:hypothetical protein